MAATDPRDKAVFGGLPGVASPQTALGPYKTSSPVDALVAERLLSSRYFTHYERFLQRPQLNATLAVTTVDPTAAEVAASFASNLNLEITGTNADDAGVEWLPRGGIRLETAGADGDEHIIQAHRDTDQTALLNIDWNSANELLFVANLVTGPDAADVTSAIIWAGWKLTSTEVTATDNDQAFFRFENDVNGGRWQAITSVAGTDDAHDTGIAVRSATTYRLVVAVDRDRVPRYYINDALVETGSALTALNTFDFYIGVAADGAAAAKELDIRSFLVSQRYG